MPTNPESEDLFIDGQNLSAEAKTVTREAMNAVRNWIDERLKTITGDARLELEKTKAQVDEEWKSAGETLEASSRALQNTIQELGAIELQLPPVETMRQAVARLKSATEAAQKELEARKQAFRLGGEKVGGALVGIVTKLAL